MTRILIVDDDAKISRIMARYLEQAGFATGMAQTGAAALDALRVCPYDLLILDILLPDTTGLTICRILRQSAGDAETRMATLAGVPVLMLSALGMTDDIVGGLRSGADDYLVKPFEPRELIERVRTLLRRRPIDQRPETCQAGDLTLDLTARTAQCGDRTLDFTRREYDLLVWLVTHPGRAFSREQLLDDVWGLEYTGSDRAVDLCILRLRGKLEAIGWSGARLETVWGSGYRLALLSEECP